VWSDVRVPAGVRTLVESLVAVIRYVGQNGMFLPPRTSTHCFTYVFLSLLDAGGLAHWVSCVLLILAFTVSHVTMLGYILIDEREREINTGEVDRGAGKGDL
jgi:hypothetical protein